MKTTMMALLGGVLGALMTLVALRHDAPAPPESGGKPAPGASGNDQVQSLTQEVASLKARLAAAEKTTPAKAQQPAENEAAASDKEAQAKAQAKREEEMKAAMAANMKARVAAKVEKLTAKLSLAPEQATVVTAWLQAHEDQVLAASMKRPRDPKDYHLNMAYRQDLPPEVQATLSEEQQAVWQKHDADSRADAVESITNGEMGFIAGTLDLSRDQKDQLFPHLSQLYMEDTYSDFANVVDLESLSAQKDADNERRRQFYKTIFDAKQMAKWEEIATSYKEGMLRQYTPAKPATAASRTE